MAKILLVEDDNNLREIYEARLQAEGYTIVSARDGEEALVVAKAEKPDLVISDVMMPKISGFEMLDILRNTDGMQAVKVIMLTALGQSDDQQRADKLGADRYLVKSQVTLEDIVKAAQELLNDGAAPAGKPATDTAGTPTAQSPTPDPIPIPTPTPTPEPEPAPPPKKEEKHVAPAEEVKPAPELAVAPAPETSETETEAAKSAEPAKEEEASVDAKIEDFVAGATTEPTTPAGTVPPPPEPAAPATPTADDTASASDDKLMADAVDTLVADTEDKPKSDSPDTAKTTEPGDTTGSETPEPEESHNTTTVAHKKIIKPLEDNQSKKDLSTLLAEEEAKESAAKPGEVTAPSATPIVVSDETGTQTITPDKATPITEPKNPPDPNSIAL